MAAPDDDRETMTGPTGAPQKPHGDPVREQREKDARSGGIDVGDVARDVSGGEATGEATPDG